jgi:iron(III) transport system permease protein
MADAAAPVAPSAPAPARAGKGGHRLGRDDIVQRLALFVLVAILVVVVVLPLYALLSKSVEDRNGAFVGLDNFAAYFATPALLNSLWNSVWVSLVTTAIVLPLAFCFAYALTRSRMPAKGLFKAVALIPILAPSLLPAIALKYLFFNNGLLAHWLPDNAIEGPLGIVVAQVFYCLPHALMILVTALATADARLYEAATALGASRWRIFFTVTVPGARFGIVSAGFVVFTLVITDFGIAKVIGGRFNVLATDIYKQVIGQQNFSMGAVVGLVLLTPALLSFVVDRWVQRKQVALLSARAVPLVPKPRAGRDATSFAYCVAVGFVIVGILAVAVWGSFIKYWPYDRSMTVANYDFPKFWATGWGPYWVSLQMSAWAALGGTILIFLGAYLVEKTRRFEWGRGAAHLVAMVPLAVPGLVLGLGYIFFFNAKGNPLNFLYGTLAILSINTVAHFYTVAHLTAVTALKQIDAEFESVSASLKVPFHVTLRRVTVPICLPAILDIFIYIFVNAMTTVSSVIFLYVAETMPAAVMIVQLEESGSIAAAAAMGTMIVITSAAAKLLQVALARALDRTQAWRRR